MTRLYIENIFKENQAFELNKNHKHYLEKVLRFKEGDTFFAFNENSGEWLVSYNKNQCFCINKIKEFKKSKPLWLAFAPLKHDAMFFLIEKATELGASDLQPIITARSNIHKISIDKIQKNAIEASQQCERMDIPTIHQPIKLEEFLNKLPKDITWHSAIERIDKTNTQIKRPAGFIVGPEGGWNDTEKNLLKANTQPIALGTNVLRAETAAIVCLSLAIDA